MFEETEVSNVQMYELLSFVALWETNVILGSVSSQTGWKQTTLEDLATADELSLLLKVTFTIKQALACLMPVAVIIPDTS